VYTFKGIVLLVHGKGKHENKMGWCKNGKKHSGLNLIKIRCGYEKELCR